MYRLLLVLLNCAQMARCQQTVLTQGNSGELCGTRRCRDKPRPSVCASGVCVCQCMFPKGLGFLECAASDEDFCGLYNDPLLTSFAGFHVHVPISYKFVLTRVRTRSCKQGRTTTILAAGQCDITVLAWGGYWKGKTFMRGVEVRYNVSQGTSSPSYRSIRIYGEAKDGLYNFTIDGNDEADPDLPGTVYGDPVSLILDIVGSTYIDVDTANNMVSVGGACGVSVSLRPADRTRHLEIVSGVTVTVNKLCEPTYPPPDRSICSSPSDDVNKFEILAAALSNQTGSHVTTKVAAMFFILKNKVVQNFPGAPPALHVLTSIQCADNYLVEAVGRCLFIQDAPTFVKCMAAGDHEPGNQVISMFAVCVSSFCVRSVVTCNQVKVNLVNNNCQRFLSSLTGTVLDFNCSRFDT